METKKISLKLFIGSLFIVLICETVMRLLSAPARAAGPQSLVIQGVIRFIEILSLVLLFYISRNNLMDLGLKPSDFGPGIKRGLIWSIGFGIIIAILFGGLYLFHLNLFELIKVKLPDKVSGLLLFFLIGGFIGPVAEEIFFRGVIYGFFRRWGMITALILSTAVFTLAHIQFTPLPISQAVGGTLFALAYEKEKNLYTPIVIHVLGNLAIFSLSL